MSTTQTAREGLTEIIIDHLGVEEKEVTDKASLADDLGADSLDIIEISMSVEEKFGIEITEDEAEKWRKVEDVLVSVQSKLTPM